MFPRWALTVTTGGRSFRHVDTGDRWLFRTPGSSPVCYAAALIAWPILTDRHDTPLLTGQAILAGLFGGAFLTARKSLNPKGKK